MKFIRIVLSVLFTLFLASCGKQKEEQTPTIPEQPRRISAAASNVEAREQRRNDIIEHAKKVDSKEVDMRNLKGHKLADLYADLLGVSGVVSKDYYTINFGEQLQSLWFKKLSRKDLTDAVIDNADIPIKRFTEPLNTMTLAQFVSQANGEVKRVKNKLDFTGVCKEYRLSNNECQVFRDLASHVRGKDLIAYGMTELLPSAEGELNVKVMEILLQNAGATYLEAIPAIHDKMLSVGLYQFTSLALRHDEDGFVGASRVNKYLPKEDQIPGSVIKLQGSEHHRAAFLFALHNLARLAKSTSVKQFRNLKYVMRDGLGDNLVIYMATAHHLPGPALKSACRWLKNGAKGSLQTFLVNGNTPYGKKSTANLEGLKQVKL
jgi:hypothetical protein